MGAARQLRAVADRICNRVATHGLSPLARAILNEGLTYLSPAKLRRMEQALQSLSGVEGEMAEFGVALGGSAILIASRARGREFHGFDVFAMIPEPSSDKDDQKSRDRYETIRSGASRGINGQKYYGYRDDLYSEVKGSFARHGISAGEGGVFLHKGLFEETLPSAKISRIAFAHIDCDWYDPVSYCLDAVNKAMGRGGIIVIDDYHAYGGCRTAVQEFLARNPRYAVEDGPNPILRKR